MIFASWFFWLIWPFKCLILMILTMAKCHENLLKESILSLLFIVKFFFPSETKIILKMPNNPFLRIFRYFLDSDLVCTELSQTKTFFCENKERSFALSKNLLRKKKYLLNTCHSNLLYWQLQYYQLNLRCRVPWVKCDNVTLSAFPPSCLFP